MLLKESKRIVFNSKTKETRLLLCYYDLKKEISGNPVVGHSPMYEIKKILNIKEGGGKQFFLEKAEEKLKEWGIIK